MCVSCKHLLISLEDIIAEQEVNSAQALLDDMVGVGKRDLKSPGELPLDGGFT
jgi:hypothetical protein